jgi:glycolate oxidase FAD binding subunit
VRDLVIGIKAALVTGEEIKAGGKVVKNVAGYDMCKLFTGSMGTLGIITEATVRLAPVPELSCTIVVSGEWRDATAFLDTLAATPLVPAAVTLLNDGGEGDKWRVAVWCEGLEQDVTRHLRDVETVAGRIGAPVETLRDGAQTVFWGKIRDMPLAAGCCIYRLIVPRAAVKSCIDALKVLGPPAPAVAGDMIAGTLWLSWPAESKFAERFPDLISLATAHRGHAVLFAAAEHLKENIDVWGPPPASIGIMQKIKQEFDPGGVLNPGRFIGGL